MPKLSYVVMELTELLLWLEKLGCQIAAPQVSEVLDDPTFHFVIFERVTVNQTDCEAVFPKSTTEVIFDEGFETILAKDIGISNEDPGSLYVKNVYEILQG